jgi:hypothetical protein
LGDQLASQIAWHNTTHVMCFLLHVFLHLNLVKASSKLKVVEDDDLFFGQVTLNDDVIISTLKNELQLFQQFPCDQQRLKTFCLVGKSCDIISQYFLSWFVNSLASWVHKLK